MNKEELISEIIDAEWPMFHSVNGEDRTTCQDQDDVFYGMRKAQFIEWDEPSLQSYLDDLHDAEKTGRNLAREKYIIMMRTTDPASYDHFKAELPEFSEKKLQLVADIWAIELDQTKVMREKYPMVALGGRPLMMDEETGWPSVENYQTAELLTFSETTLENLLAHIRRQEENGISFAAKISENSVLAAGYRSLDDAEDRIFKKFFGRDNTRCACCGD